MERKKMEGLGKAGTGKRRLRLLLLLPMVLLPFVLLGLYAMGVGRDAVLDGSGASVAAGGGISTALPEASLSVDTPRNKAEYYERAERLGRDSAKGLSGVAAALGFGEPGLPGLPGLPGAGVAGGDAAAQSRALEDRMASLQRELSRPEGGSVHGAGGRSGTGGAAGARRPDAGMKSEVDRLEQLMRSMQSGRSADPEMAQLDGLMQGILDIQHPGRVLERERSLASGVPDSVFRACPAVVWGRQRVASGGVVRLKLMDTLRVSGMLLPSGQELFGACRVANQRLLVEVRHVRLGTSIVPVDLSVYGLDGMPGVRAPDAQLSEALGSGSEQAMRGMGLGGYDSSVAVQVAGAGIDAARGLLSRKVRRIRVKLEAGLPLLLRDNGRK